MIKIICVGNRFAYPDNFGILVYEYLKDIIQDENIKIIEGGVGGLNLATHFEDDCKYLIVDYGKFDKNILTKDDIKKIKIDEYNHSNALIYLLKTIDKDFKVFICNKDFNKSDIKNYSQKILNMVKNYEIK